MSGGTIEGNNAYNNGGGLYAHNTSVALNSGKIRGNTLTPDGSTPSQGGGVWFTALSSAVAADTLTLGAGIEISGNTISGLGANVLGGGIYYDDSSSLTTTGLTIPAGARITGNRVINTTMADVFIKGGGIYFKDSTGGTLQIVNGSSITGNAIATGRPSPTNISGNGVFYAGGGSVSVDTGAISGNLRGFWNGTTITNTTQLPTEQVEF
jgi:hypothetical protein